MRVTRRVRSLLIAKPTCNFERAVPTSQEKPAKYSRDRGASHSYLGLVPLHTLSGNF